MSTLEVNSLIHLDASSNNLDLDSSGNATVNGNMTATQFYGGGGNLTGVGVDGIVSTANATAITIDSNENVGIGTSSPQNLLHVQSGDSANDNYRTGGDSPLIVEGTTASYIQFVADANAPMGILMGDTSDTAVGGVTYDANGGGIRLKSGGSNRVYVSTAGFVGIGTASPSALLTVQGSGESVIRHNDAGGTGRFTLGLSGTSTKLMTYQAGDSIVFSTGGSGAEKFRIQAGSGISFNGDTAAANALDDYEEGTWTPTLQDSSNNAATYLQNEGGYTKIGRTVNVFGTLYINSLSGVGSTLKTAGLPFANGTGTGTGNYSSATIGSMRIMNIGSGMALSGPIWKGESHINWKRSYMTSNNNPSSLDAGHLGYASQWVFQMTYQTD